MKELVEWINAHPSHVLKMRAYDDGIIVSMKSGDKIIDRVIMPYEIDYAMQIIDFMCKELEKA